MFAAIRIDKLLHGMAYSRHIWDEKAYATSVQHTLLLPVQALPLSIPSSPCVCC